jgi:hypothetical protein
MVATASDSLKTRLYFYSQFALLNHARLNLRDWRFGGTPIREE